MRIASVECLINDAVEVTGYHQFSSNVIKHVIPVGLRDCFHVITLEQEEEVGKNEGIYEDGFLATDFGGIKSREGIIRANFIQFDRRAEMIRDLTRNATNLRELSLYHVPTGKIIWELREGQAKGMRTLDDKGSLTDSMGRQITASFFMSKERFLIPSTYSLSQCAFFETAELYSMNGKAKTATHVFLDKEMHHISTQLNLSY